MVLTGPKSMPGIWLLALLLPALAVAETAYVTDLLRLNVYSSPDFSGSTVRALVSGDAFEVLRRERLATAIELPDGTRGYVRSAYLVKEKPARLIVAETRAEIDRLSAELAEVRAAFADPAAEIDTLKQRIAGLDEALAARQAVNAKLNGQIERLENAVRRYHRSVPLNWSLAALLVALAGGFLGGLKYVDRQIRRRHGGIRVH